MMITTQSLRNSTPIPKCKVKTLDYCYNAVIITSCQIVASAALRLTFTWGLRAANASTDRAPGVLSQASIPITRSTLSTETRTPQTQYATRLSKPYILVPYTLEFQETLNPRKPCHGELQVIRQAQHSELKMLCNASMHKMLYDARR